MDIKYFQPSTLQEACGLLNTYMEQAKLLAGGTDLAVNMRSGKDRPGVIVDLCKIEEIKGIKAIGEELHIGSLVTFSELVNSEVVQANASVLVAAAKAVGSPQIRNRGTVGGNVANASPAADVVPALVALEGEAVLVKEGSSREISLQDLFIGPYKTTIGCDEIISLVKVKIPAPVTGMSFKKVGRRNSLAIARLNGACLLRKNGPIIEEVSLVIGSVMPKPRKLTVVEEYLAGQEASSELFGKAGELAREYVFQVTGQRASSVYKLPVVENLTAGLLEEAWLKGGTLNE